MSDTFPPGFLASALIAAKTGNQPRARQAIDRLVALQPMWRDNPRHELEKVFHAQWMVERLLRDLSELGLGATTAEVGGAPLGEREITCRIAEADHSTAYPPARRLPAASHDAIT